MSWNGIKNINYCSYRLNSNYCAGNIDLSPAQLSHQILQDARNHGTIGDSIILLLSIQEGTAYPEIATIFQSYSSLVKYTLDYLLVGRYFHHVRAWLWIKPVSVEN